jgi:hypothetical protein
MPTDKNNPKERSLKPPREWFEKKRAEIKKGNPDYTDEQIDATIGKIWYHEMSKHQRSERRHEEGKEYGKAPEMKKSIFAFKSMQKSQKVLMHPDNEMMNEQSSIPAIICEHYDKEGTFEEMRVVTAKEVLEKPESFDSRTFAYLIRNLGKKLAYEYNSDDQLKCTQVIIDLAEELESRIKEEREAKKKLQDSMDTGKPIAFENNWQKKKEYFMGKSIMNLPVNELEDFFSDEEGFE